LAAARTCWAAAIGGFASMAAAPAAAPFRKLRRPAEDFFDFDMVWTSL
jgi:hypothetical protein